jgi:AcrR family transcriptional regulator
MALTPWGDSTELRERMLPLSRWIPREASERNQRERQYAAMLALVAERGFAGTRVADVLKLAGIGRRDFYRYFSDPEDCFAAALEEVTERVLEWLDAELEQAGELDDLRRVFERVLELIVSQPVAAKALLVEAHAAGPRAAACAERASDGFERIVARALEKAPDRAGMPPELVRAIAGGVQQVIRKRLRRGEEEELPGLAPELWQWILSCPPPPGPLKAPRRRAPQTPSFEQRQASANPPERILRALAEMASEKGLGEVVAEEVSKRASTSNRAFYRNFANKQVALVAALDSGYSQLLAAALPAFRRATDWPHAIRDAIEAMLASAVADPEFPQLSYVAVYGDGQRALERREASAEGLEGLLARGYELKPETLPIASEAIIGAVFALINEQVKARGLRGLLALVPAATYLILAPFLGAEKACAVAVS